MKKIMTNIIFLIFIFFILIYPLSFGIFDVALLIKIIFLGFIIICFFTFLKSKFNVKFKIDEKYYVYIILFISFLSKLFVVLKFNDNVVQVSDFAGAFNAALTNNFNDFYHQVFTHWIYYPKMMNYIFSVFGSSQKVALITNAVLLSINSILIYYLCNIVLKNKKYSFIASLIYVLWPANLLYTLIFTQEHFCQTLILLALILFFNIKVQLDKRWQNYIYSILLGIILGFIPFFKNFSPVLIITFIIYYIIYYYFNGKITIKIFIKNVLYVAIFFLVSFLVKNSLYDYADIITNRNVVRNITACYLNVGLRDNGFYSSTNYQEYMDELIKNNYDYKKTNSVIISNLVKSFDTDKPTITNQLFWKNKAIVIYGSDSARITWVRNSVEESNTIDDFSIFESIEKYNNYYFIIVVLLMIIGLIPMYVNKNFKIFALYLLFYGGMLLLILVEAQNRYYYSLVPVMCILASCGYSYIGGRNEKNIKKLYKIIKM